MPDPDGTLRVGIAGYGSTGQIRRRYVDAHPQMRTVAYCDQMLEEGVDADGVRRYVDYESLLAQEELDVLFVCLWNNVAPDATIAGLERGLHVFCEKPPGRTVEDIERVRETELRHPHLKLKYGFNHRYHDSVRDWCGTQFTGMFQFQISICTIPSYIPVNCGA